MSCLSEQQLILGALGIVDESAAEHAADHIAGCSECSVKLAGLQGLSRRLSKMHAQAGIKHALERAALLEMLPEPSEIISQGRLRADTVAVRSRWALVICSLGGVLAIASFWLAGSASHVAAMQRMAENIRDAKSYRLDVEMFKKPTQAARVAGAPEAPRERLTGTMWFKSPNWYRLDIEGTIDGAPVKRSEVFVSNRKGVVVDHVMKQFRRLARESDQLSPRLWLDTLGSHTDQATRDLGFKTIAGRQARGFEIAWQDVDSRIARNHVVEVWLDTATKLPVLIKNPAESSDSSTVQVMQNIEWNVDLAPELFVLHPPQGYAIHSREVNVSDEQIDEIVSSLKYYADAHDRRFPINRPEPAKARNEMLKAKGFGSLSPGVLWTNEYRDIAKATQGFGTISAILKDCEDSEYYGLSVPYGDAERVLLYWQAQDGQYQVIYGDLHTEKLSAERFERIRPGN